MSNLEVLNSAEYEILNNLNEPQSFAVCSIMGSNLVIAGAGAGKTAVLTRRVAYLINKEVIPGQILCLTFTNKAAHEMNLRVRSLLGEVGINLPHVPPWKQDYLQNSLLCTFHSLGVRLLREFGEKIELKKEFTILDSDDQKKIIRRILKELNVSEKNLQPSLVSYFISQCKQELLIASDSRKITKDFLPIFHQIYRKYEDLLQSTQSVDFDDLILKPYLLLRDHLDVREILQDRWRHVMVDEFQDTNPAQFELIKLLMPIELLQSDTTRSLFVVGDDAQSIYGFRGSKVEIILNFEDQYPGTKEVVLNQNYRSVQKILDLAESVIAHNPNQKKKELFTQNPEEIDVHYYIARNEKDEAEFILRKLRDLYVDEKTGNAKTSIAETSESQLDSSLQETKTPEIAFQSDEQEFSQNTINYTKSNDPISSMFDVYLETDSQFSSPFGSYTSESWGIPETNWRAISQLNNVTILYRTHSQSRAIEETFLKYHVPYKLVSGTRFLDRKEIKDVLAILKFVSNGSDRVSAGRFMPLVMDGVGAKTIEKMMAYLEDYDYPLSPKHGQMLMDLIGKLSNCWQNSTSLIDLTKELLTVSGYMRYLKGEYPIKEEFNARLENIGEIYSLMFPFDEDKTISMTERLNLFLSSVMLMTTAEMDEQDETPKVSLMSLHQSKGLEYDTVFLIGIEDGLLPHQNSFMEVGGMEEEVRLAYVGVTRAKKHLYLTCAESRVQFGQIKANPLSRIFRPFIDTQVKRSR
jgi:DNA helicase II / ATP-dependent DNA helicase PcrA